MESWCFPHVMSTLKTMERLFIWGSFVFQLLSTSVFDD